MRYKLNQKNPILDKFLSSLEPGISLSIMYGDFRKIRNFVEKGHDINHFHALLASMTDHFKLARYFIDAYLDNQDILNRSLCISLLYGMDDTTKYLLNNGADPSINDGWNWNLKWICEPGAVSIFRIDLIANNIMYIPKILPCFFHPGFVKVLKLAISGFRIRLNPDLVSVYRDIIDCKITIDQETETLLNIALINGL
jgi:hypothetical protein